MIPVLAKLFQKAEKSDSTRLKTEAQLSFENSQLDKRFLFHHLKDGFCDPVGFKSFIVASLGYKIGVPISLDDELQNLKSYISLGEEFTGRPVESFFDISEDTLDLKISPFILFTLIQNAFHNGYHLKDKDPVRIKVRLIGETIFLEVSNRVNHYISDQSQVDIVNYFKGRLAYEYPDQFDLFLNSNSNRFKATLRIRL